jgi:hypothetical protein
LGLGIFGQSEGEKSWFKKILFYDLLQGFIDEGHFINPLRKICKNMKTFGVSLIQSTTKKN